MNQHAKRNAGYTLVAGLVLLLYCWLTTPIYWENEEFLNLTISVFYWTLRCSGVALLIIAGLRFTGLRIGLILDALVSGICGSVMVLCSLYWFSVDGLAINNILFLIFGSVFCREAFTAFTDWRDSADESMSDDWPQPQVRQSPAEPIPKPRVEQPPAPKPDPVHPASIRPSSLPRDGEPAPPEGYLAKLAEEDGEPPTASHE